MRNPSLGLCPQTVSIIRDLRHWSPVQRLMWVHTVTYRGAAGEWGAQGWKRGLMNPGSDTSHALPSWREFPIDHTREKLVKI